jgi:hypothetical protein
MFPERNRFLLLLVLLAMVATAGWTTALAGGKADSAPASSSLASLSKPPVVPTSGEPDVGQTPHPTTTTGSVVHDPRGEAGHLKGSSGEIWFRWTLWTWAMRFFGAR